MSAYAKETVAKLQEILKARSLPTSGKKADLIARLQEADEAAETNEAEAAPPAPSTSAPPAQDSSTIQQEAAPEEAANDAPEESAPTATAETAPQPDYSLHLAQSTLDSEIEKRKARAARFGTSNAAGTDETPVEGADTADQDKALARAQRFGLSATETATIGKLDVALSSEKGRRRGPREGAQSNGNASFDDPGLIRRGGRGGRGGRFGGGRNRREGSAGARPTGVEKRGPGYNEADRKAADARKARFAAQG